MWLPVLLGIIFVKGLICQDPCDQAKPLEGSTRSVKYLLGPNDPDLCDRRLLNEGWYKIQENGNIATECPEMFRCGSLYPIWLNGTLPIQGQRTTLRACQRGFTECCQSSFSVEVKNCNLFNVFYLTTIPACPGRYCIVGPPAPCLPGTASETGFEPCQTLNITFSILPTVEAFIADPNLLAFRCQTSMPSEYEQNFFDVAWYINKTEITLKQNIQHSDLDTYGVLYQTDWNAHKNGPKTLGFWVRCSMRARQYSGSVPTPYKTSNAFYAGAQIQKTAFTVKSGEKVNISIKFTVPLVCVRAPGHTRCNISIELFSLKDQIQSNPANCNESSKDNEIEMSKSTCGLLFDGTKWNTYQIFTLHTLSDQASRPSYTCKAKLISKSGYNSLWLNYQLPEVSIHVLNELRPKGMCYSKNDPQIQTFDHKTYMTHEKGEFVLFRHKIKPIEVHTIQRWEDDFKWGSNCAIMIRAASDMFVIYGCNSPTRWITRRLNCDSDHEYLEVFERLNSFEVVLPTGTRIDVTVHKSWLNIDVHVSASDWEQTEGLCGTYNGNKDDDFTNKNGNIVDETEFVKSWEVPGSKSLFIAKSRKEKMKTEVFYCTCYKESVVSDDKTQKNTIERKADCTWKESLTLCKPQNWKVNTCLNYGRTKREIADDFEFDVPIDVVKFEQGPKNFEWKNGWTEQKAVNACESFFKKSKLFNMCSKITNSSNVEKDTCVADIKISGSDVFLSASLDSMKTSCINEIRINTTFWKPKPKPKMQTTTERSMQLNIKTQSTTTTTTARNLGIPVLDDISVLDIAESIFNNDCPNDCSGSGICQQGICDCGDGFEGEDCSVDRRKGPEVFGLIEESFCDLSQRPCSSVSVFGNGFYASGTVTCLIMEAKIEQNEVKPEIMNITTYGSLMTFSEVKCPLEHMNVNESQTFPVVDAYLVSVSFDAVKYSTGSPIIVYDSTCTICKGVKGIVDCRMREDVCIVERKCYRQDHDMCKKTKASEPSRHTYSPAILYLGATLGGLGIIVVPTLIFMKRM